MSGRVLVVGIDGGTFDVLKPLAEQGRVPHLARLMREGVTGDLRSTIHPITPAAWCTFMTGMNPGRHGIYDFTARQENSYVFGLASRANCKGPAFWRVASEQGRRTTVVNVPFTYPPDPVNGCMISGFDAPVIDRTIFHPDGLQPEIEKEVGKYIPDWTFPTGRKFDPPAYMVDIEEALSYRTKLALYLMKRDPWDFFMVHFQPVDHLQHVFWDEEGMQYIERGYELIDKALGQVLEEAGEDTNVFVVSDHGFGRIEKFVFLGQFLRQEGFLSRTDGEVSAKAGLGFLARKVERTLKRALPFRIRGALRRRMPGLRNRIVAIGDSSDVDWSKTTAYATGMYGNVNVNLKGREPQGIVDPEDYEKTRDELIASISRIEDPDTGENIVEAVYKREEVYDGGCVPLAPDLLVHWKDYAYYAESRIDRGRGSIFGETGTVFFDNSEYPQTGTHRLNGMLVGHGPDIQSGADVPDLRLMDMAPTILYLMGLGIPEDMDGQVLGQLIREEFREKSEPKMIAPLTGFGPHVVPDVDEEEKRKIEEKLRGLGYL
jgi:predicted AlkP superfamily phosphohydrolase/phosphomutase